MRPTRRDELQDFYVSQLNILQRHVISELKQKHNTVERLRRKSQTLELVLAKLGYDAAVVEWLNEGLRLAAPTDGHG